MVSPIKVDGIETPYLNYMTTKPLENEARDDTLIEMM